jgi:predicted RNase H-like HicB family nuclease
MESKYGMIICWRHEDGAFVVEVPELPGCMADGPTYPEAVANVQTIIREWLETAAQVGRPVPQPRGRPNYA